MYNSPVATNNDLYDELDNMLSDDFEDNIVNVFGKYIEEIPCDEQTNKRIAKFYAEAREAYLNAVASIIMYPDALNYVDYPEL